MMQEHAPPNPGVAVIEVASPPATAIGASLDRDGPAPTFDGPTPVVDGVAATSGRSSPTNAAKSGGQGQPP
ncbi:MAG: hypothetical protein V5A37_02875 [Halobacteriales archaeon]